MRQLLSLLALWTLLLSQSSAQVQMDRINATGVNGAINPLRFSGSDFGAQVNAASAFCGANCIIDPPTGNYTYSTVIVLAANQTFGDCRAGANQINLTYNGTGAAISTTSSDKICGISLTTGTSATDGFLLKGQDVWLEDSYYIGGGASTKGVHIAAFNSTTQSGKVYVKQLTCLNTLGTQLYIDHVIEAHVDHMYCSSTGASGIGAVIDTGSAGVHIADSAFSLNALGGLIVKNSTGGAGAYNAAPIQLWFESAVFDCALSACPGKDAILFDSSLGTNPMYAQFNKSWGAGYGSTPSPANGLHISGGQGIYFHDGYLRSNFLNGALIDSSNVSDIAISKSFITANNVSNNADGQGVYITAAASRVHVSENDIGNHLDPGGNQKFGIKIAAVLANDFTALGNDLRDNVSGSYSTSNTGIQTWVNTDIPGGTSCVFGGAPSSCKAFYQGDLNVHGSLFEDGPIFAASMNASGTYQIGGGTMFASATAPTISTHFNTSGDSITANGTVAFTITVGSGAAGSTGVLTLPAAAHGWACSLKNQSRADDIQQTSQTVTSVTFTNFGTTFAATNWTNGDVLVGGCNAY